MKRITCLIALMALLLAVPVTLVAQDVNSIYLKAADAFEMGRFELADSLLIPHLKHMKSADLIKSYRLLALSALQQDNLENAQMYAGKLLAEDPFYTAYGDSPRFSDILTELKKGKSTVTTASKMEESVEEVPVPLILITEQMIQASGAQTLGEVLQLYVPGLTKIASIEDNVAMRGVYGMGQETMLVMVDGHRMNSQTTNAEPLDYRHNLESVKQIEVLRGPASSLYGNVALTAVVNIITKPGSEIDGVHATVKTGSFDSYDGSILFGHGNLKSEYLAWVALHQSKGETHKELAGNTRYVGGYNQEPTMEMGLKVRWGDFNVLAYAQHAKTVPYYNLLELSDVFEYDAYGRVNGKKPGFARTTFNLNLDYTRSWENFSLSLSAYGNKENAQIYNSLGDTIPYQIIAPIAQAMNLPSIRTRGVWETISWQDYSVGTTVNGVCNYRLSDSMYGSILGGLQYENLYLSDGMLLFGADFTELNNVRDNIVDSGSEHVVSAFTQLKHNFGPRLILNGGLRFDHKMRNDKRKLNTLSPRMSLIWLPSKIVSFKACYAHSFVDAPVFYRASRISLFSGGSEMEPEEMDAFQLGGNFKFAPIHLSYEINLFYNQVRKLVYFTPKGIASMSNAFGNSGNINMGGIENVLQYSTDNLLLNLNCTYQHPFKVQDFASLEHTVSNVPKWIVNLTASKRVFNSKQAGQGWVRCNMHAQSHMECQDNSLLHLLQDPMTLYLTHQKAYALFGAGVEWKSNFGLDISLDAHNLLDTDCVAGGPLKMGVPLQGFGVVGKVSYDF